MFFFELVHDLNDQDTPYSVLGVGLTGVNREDYLSQFGRFIRAPYCINGAMISRYCRSPGFRLRGTERIARDGRDLIKFTFESGTGVDLPPERRDRGWLLVDPDAGWSIQSGEIYYGIYKQARPISWDVEYAPSDNEGPLPKSVTIRDADGETARCDFFEIGRASTPIAEYSMEYYGLPDIASSRSPQPGQSAWVITAGLAVMTLALSFAIRLAAQRRSRDS